MAGGHQAGSHGGLSLLSQALAQQSSQFPDRERALSSLFARDPFNPLTASVLANTIYEGAFRVKRECKTRCRGFNFCTGGSKDCHGARVQLSLQLRCSDAQTTS
eukprot:3903297-Amphidinium_carterae.2